MQEERCNYDEIIMSIIKYDLCERTTRLDWTKINKQKGSRRNPKKRNEEKGAAHDSNTQRGSK